MSEDMVARLREEILIIHMVRLPRESKLLYAAADEIERLRAELRTYTGDGHNTKGEPCTQNTPS